jgi:hypothetical protein
MEASDYNIQPIYKYVKELERVTDEAAEEKRKGGKASTMYYLTQYLDRRKNKTK